LTSSPEWHWPIKCKWWRWWGETGDAGYFNPDAYFWASEIEGRSFFFKATPKGTPDVQVNYFGKCIAIGIYATIEIRLEKTPTNPVLLPTRSNTLTPHHGSTYNSSSTSLFTTPL
jgi:hypothetical protein